MEARGKSTFVLISEGSDSFWPVAFKYMKFRPHSAPDFAPLYGYSGYMMPSWLRCDSCGVSLHTEKITAGLAVREEPADQQVRQRGLRPGGDPLLLLLVQIPPMHDVRCGGSALVLLCTHIPPSCILTLTGEQTQVCSYLDRLNSPHTKSPLSVMRK